MIVPSLHRVADGSQDDNFSLKSLPNMCVSREINVTFSGNNAFFLKKRHH